MCIYRLPSNTSYLFHITHKHVPTYLYFYVYTFIYFIFLSWGVKINAISPLCTAEPVITKRVRTIVEEMVDGKVVSREEDVDVEVIKS